MNEQFYTLYDPSTESFIRFTDAHLWTASPNMIFWGTIDDTIAIINKTLFKHVADGIMFVPVCWDEVEGSYEVDWEDEMYPVTMFLDE